MFLAALQFEVELTKLEQLEQFRHCGVGVEILRVES